ncbi:MAG: hypothetical protein AAB404_00375 [Patescibacteria group bacterium]
MFSLKTIKNKLEKEKKALEVEINSLNTPPQFGDDMDESEKTDEIEAFGANLGLQQVLKNRLENINSALRKMEQEKYGFCEQCGKKMSRIILRILPDSRLCQKCKKLLKK